MCWWKPPEEPLFLRVLGRVNEITLGRKKNNCLISFISPETGERGSFSFSFSDRVIYRREEGPSSLLCILIMCWSAQLIWKLNLARAHLSIIGIQNVFLTRFWCLHGGQGFIGLEWITALVDWWPNNTASIVWQWTRTLGQLKFNVFIIMF
jgi:hypothetical protein